jgi:hypothetical protein
LVGGFSARLKLMNDVLPVGPAVMVKVGFPRMLPLKLLLAAQPPPPPPPPPPPGRIAFIHTGTFAPIRVFFTFMGRP